MKYAGHTKQERSFTLLMRIWTVAFLATGIIFAVAPDYIPKYIDGIGTVLLGWSSSTPQTGEGKFWIVLTVAFLFSLSYMCAIVQKNPVRNSGYARPVIFSKLVSTLGFALCFILFDKQFIYFVGMIVDGFIFLITWSMYRSAMRSRA